MFFFVPIVSFVVKNLLLRETSDKYQKTFFIAIHVQFYLISRQDGDASIGLRKKNLLNKHHLFYTLKLPGF
jgi:hypothetical protein